MPRPFATVAIAIGAPIGVPDTNDDVVEGKRRELEESLAALEQQALALARRGASSES